MTIEVDIIEWALQRPAWQQEVLVGLAEGEEFTPARIGALVDEIVAGTKNEPNLEAKRLQIKPAAVERIDLAAITDLIGVNALVGNQRLEFGSTGVTVIYGDNGSGKSGYARLVKALVSARHTQEILPNVFESDPSDPAGVLEYTVAGQPHKFAFPGETPPQLLKMRFYDEHCGDEYLTRQSTISYRPSALVLLDGLISVCTDIRSHVAQRIAASESSALALELPRGTAAEKFFSQLSAATTYAQVETATCLPDGFGEDLAAALQEEARLAGSDPGREQARLTSSAGQLEALATDLTRIVEHLGAEQTTRVLALRDAARTKREAASLAARESFDGEPLEGIGSETWRALWQAARAYSTESYHDHPFPVTGGGSVCVLCQQELDEDARSRLQRFDRYLADTTETDAVAAERTFSAVIAGLREMEFATPARIASITLLTSENAELGSAATELLAIAESYRDAVAAHVMNDAAQLPNALSTDVPGRVKTLAASLRAQADATDVATFREALGAATARKSALHATHTLAEAKERVHAEVARRAVVDGLREASAAADTKAITLKSAALTRKYATQRILDQFTRETERLRLQRVTLQDKGGQKGKLNQMPGLLGTTRDVAARSVLSEGEQTAMGLAGFFTEAEFDESRSAIIFDDPVTSLDHQRRDRVAERLVQLGKDRQVIVFTHDVAFTGDIAAAAAREGVTLTERSVERRGGTHPGVCKSSFPWKAKDVKSRIGFLQAELDRMKKDRLELAQTDWETRVATWAGLLSEAWERAVTGEIMNHVFDRGTSEVRMLKFRMLAKVSEQDNQDLQDGYSATSRWARRHDKAIEVNYVAPEPGELQVELDRIRAWRTRVTKYLQ